jgi:hypothetical protein
MTSAISGRSSPTPFATYDPDTSSWRTSQATFLSGLTEFSGIWPSSFSMRKGSCFQRRMSVLAIDVSESSSSLPTPTGSDQNGPGHSAQGGMNLRTAVTFLPTPAGSNPNDGEEPDHWQARYDFHASKAEGATRAGTPLAIAVRRLPTPTVGDSKSAANRTAGRLDPDSKHHDGVTLTDAVRMLPTPTTSDAKGPSPSHGGTTAEAIGDLGASTRKRSTGTRESSDDGRLDLGMTATD